MIEPNHQPLDPADRADGGQQLPVEIVGCPGLNPTTTPSSTITVGDSAAIAIPALAWASRHRLRPNALAVLMALATGADSQAELVVATNISRTGIRAALAKLTGDGRRLKQCGAVPGLEKPLVRHRPHPHGRTEQQRQYRLTAAGDDLVLELLGIQSQPLDPPAPESSGELT